jgi:hypothetical protein
MYDLVASWWILSVNHPTEANVAMCSLKLDKKYTKLNLILDLAQRTICIFLFKRKI